MDFRFFFLQSIGAQEAILYSSSESLVTSENRQEIVKFNQTKSKVYRNAMGKCAWSCSAKLMNSLSSVESYVICQR